MKEVWKDLCVKDIVKLNYGKGLPKSERNPDGAYPVYGANGIMDWSDKVLATGPSIVIGRKGSAGELKVAKGPFWPSDVTYFTTHDPSAVDFEYLYYLLQHLNLPSLAKGVKPGINRNDVYSLKVPLPPLDQQKRIVSILDQSFEGLDRARANAEANLESARELYFSILRDTFSNYSDKWLNDEEPDFSLNPIESEVKNRSRSQTKTGGRSATLRPILGNYSLSVLQPELRPRAGWKWSLLTDLAKLESGHTPSRKHPEYWDGDIPWIGIKDARDHHGGEIYNTNEYTNNFGINNSSARVLPKGTVCLSRTASVGYVTIMGQDMATSQDFVNWVCSEALIPEYLQYLLIAQGKDILRFASGSVHQTIYFPEVKAFYICHPPRSIQKQICERLEKSTSATSSLTAEYEEQIKNIKNLGNAILQKAFSGELT